MSVLTQGLTWTLCLCELSGINRLTVPFYAGIAIDKNTPPNMVNVNIKDGDNSSLKEDMFRTHTN